MYLFLNNRVVEVECGVDFPFTFDYIPYVIQYQRTDGDESMFVYNRLCLLAKFIVGAE